MQFKRHSLQRNINANILAPVKATTNARSWKNNHSPGLSSYGGSADEVLVLTARPLFTLRDLQQLTCNETEGIGQMCKVTLTLFPFGPATAPNTDFRIHNSLKLHPWWRSNINVPSTSPAVTAATSLVASNETSVVSNQRLSNGETTGTNVHDPEPFSRSDKSPSTAWF